MRRLSVIVAVAAVLQLCLPCAEAEAKGWRRIVKEDGITVYVKDVPGRGFPTFRGVGIVYANIFDVMAVLSDIERYPEWVENCATARLLKKFNELERVIYQRTDAPWPISDRDSVNRSKVAVDLKRRTVNIKFWAVKSRAMPKVDGVVRMDDLRGHYLLTEVSENKTRIDFKVDADPAGMIPTWLAKLATRRLPLKSIQRLRKQVKRTKGWYAERIKLWRAGNYLTAKKQ